MSGPSQVILLVEDRRQQQLLARFLRRIGLSQVTRTVPLSAGKGSGAQWVLERFPTEVAAYRSRASHASTKLIVVLDADMHTVPERIRQLDDSLQRANLRRIDDDVDRIARLVPKRNVETWILCLNNQEVDEKEDYKRTWENWDDLISTGSLGLFAWTRPNAAVPSSCVPSLRAGIRELLKAGL